MIKIQQSNQIDVILFDTKTFHQPFILKYSFVWADISVDSDPAIRPFICVFTRINIFPRVRFRFSFQIRIPRVHHTHPMVAAHSVDVSEFEIPLTGKSKKIISR